MGSGIIVVAFLYPARSQGCIEDKVEQDKARECRGDGVDRGRTGRASRALYG